MSSEQVAYTVQSFHLDKDPEAFRQAMAVRTEVFVEEQAVPPELELDEYESDCTHWLLMDSGTGEALATGRLRPYQEGCQMRPVAKIERVAVRKAMRGRKLGKRIMQAMLDGARREGFEQAILDAQTHALAFYEKLGFIAEGEEFMDANIPHYRMRLVLR